MKPFSRLLEMLSPKTPNHRVGWGLKKIIDFSGQSMTFPGLLNFLPPKIPTWTPWGGVGFKYIYVDFLGSS